MANTIDTAQLKRGKQIIVEMAVTNLLEAIGEDPNRDGLKDTPKRVAKSYLNELCSGYDVNPLDHLKTFDSDGYEGMVVVKDIPIVSLCEHHLLPFLGHCHIAYIPGNNRVVGLSKLARVVDAYAKRLQVQERLTTQIADCLMEGLQPLGVLVTIAAQHSCMAIRGVNKVGALTVTSIIRGVFKDNPAAKAEAFQLLQERNGK